MFSKLGAAPDETAPATVEKPNKRQRLVRVKGFFSPKHDAISEGAQPATYCHMLDLPRQAQEIVKASPIRSYGQNGVQYFEQWIFFCSSSKSYSFHIE